MVLWSVSSTLHMSYLSLYGPICSRSYLLDTYVSDKSKCCSHRLTHSVSGTTFCWGILTLCTAWAGSYEHLIAIRILLGVFEGMSCISPYARTRLIGLAGLFPCITVYVMMNYRREETGRRMSYIFSCAAFAGAVGGLIAGGLVRIESGSMTGWQYLYVVSG